MIQCNVPHVEYVNERATRGGLSQPGRGVTRRQQTYQESRAAVVDHVAQVIARAHSLVAKEIWISHPACERTILVPEPTGLVSISRHSVSRRSRSRRKGNSCAPGYADWNRAVVRP